MDNTMRKQLLMRHRQSGFPGSIIDVFAAAEQGIDLIGQFEQQQNMQVAQTPEQQQQGLRPAHQAGNVTQSMAFPNVPPNTPFNTVGMKAPINIQKFDEQGHLVKSYENVPPGVRNLPTGPQRGTVIETPANMQSGGRRLKKDALEMFPALKALGNVKVKADTEFTKEKTGIGDIEYFAPGQEVITYPTGERVEHPGSDRRHTVLVNPDTNDAQNVALDMLHGLPAEDPKYGMLIEEFGEALGETDPKHFYELAKAEGFAEDGYDQFRQNYIDGKIRNLLFQGSEDDFTQARYNSTEREDMQRYNPIAYEKFLEIERHLKSPRKKMQAGGVQEGGRLEEAMRLIKEHNMKDDSTFENIVEMFDPTGISAWDDAYRAYNSMKERGSSTPNFDEALDMLGAIPVMGKTKAAVNLYKKSHKPIRYGLTQAYNKIFRHTGRAASIADGIEDETGFLDSKEQSKPVQRQEGGVKDNTRVSMPELQDQEAFNPYSNLHLPPSGRIDYSGANVEDLLGVGALLKAPVKAVTKNAYKINPFATKLNDPNAFFRIAGRDALRDAQERGVISAKPLPKNATFDQRYFIPDFPSFAKGKPDLRYLKNSDDVIFKSTREMFKRNEINPVTGKKIRGTHWAYRAIDPKTGRNFREIPLEEVYEATPHWLRGYRHINEAGGPKKYQGAGALEFGQTGPDFETYGPGLRVDGETYQASRETGATRVPLFGDGTQRPILLGAAEVYDEPLSGVPQDYTPETKALADEGAAGVAERRNQAAGIGLAAVGDYFSAAQRYGVSAPLSLAMGKTPNLSATPLMDRALGAESPNAFPSEVLGVQNPYGAAAIDMVTDPGTALGLGLLGKSAVQQGSRAASRLSAGNRFRTGLTNPATRKTYSGSDIAKGLEANAKRYGINIDAQDIARRTTRTRPGTAAFDKPTASQAFGDALVEYPRVMREADVTLREQYLQGAPGRDRIMGNFDELYGSAAPNQEIDDAFRQFFISKKEDHVYGPTLRTPGSAAQRQFLRDRYAQHFDTNVVKSIPELNVHYKIKGAKGFYDPNSHSIHNSTQAMGFGMHDRGRGLKHATRSLDSARSLQTHEGTHALFPYRDSPAMERKVGDQLRGGLPKAEYTTPSRLEPGSYNRYLRSPTEVDARVAEMRLKMSQGANRSGNFNLQDRGEIDNLLSRVESDKRFAKKFAKDAGVRIDNSRNHLRDVTKSQGPLVDIGIGRLYNSKFTPRVRGFGRNVMGLMGFGPTGYQRQATEYLNLAKYARKRGGPRKFQSGGFADRNYLPPIAQEIERAGGFDEYQAQQEQASNLKNINNRPTISQGNFDVDEEGNIIKERASTLDMLANPMATLRTALDPSVEGLPSAGELNSAKSKGNVAGQIANDMVNPAAWVNYGKNAVRDLSQGNFTSAGLNALGAIPGIPSAAGLGKTAMKYGRSPYLLNTNRANKYDFRNIGDKPHLWRGYENTSIDPTRLDPNSNFRGYFDDLYTTESVAKKPIWDEFKSQPTNYSRTSPEAHQAAHKTFRRMDDAATEARTAFNAKHAPFLGDEVGRGSYGRVYQFKNNPDYVFKIGKSEGSNANPAFQRALEQFGNRSNIATPLQKSNFTITEPHFGNSAGAGEALVMRNLNSPTFGTQQFAGLNARQARALQIKTARQLRDAGIGLDFAADARNLASSNVSPNLTNFFDLHYRPGLQHDSRYLANQFLRK